MKYTGVHESALTARVSWQADVEEEPPPLPPARGLDLLASHEAGQAEDTDWVAVAAEAEVRATKRRVEEEAGLGEVAPDAGPAGNSTQAAFVRGQVARHKVAKLALYVP